MSSTSDIPLADADFEAVRAIVYSHCGIALSEEKRAMVRARLAKQIRAGGFKSVRSYLDFALTDRKSQAFASLIDAITTNLTSFFREAEHFRYLADTALPAIFERKSTAINQPLLGWSAACSSGEEPYSIGMTVLDALEDLPQFSRPEFRLLATDISTRMLAKAEAGVYDDSRVAAISPALRNKYFTPVSDPSPDAVPSSRVKPALQSSIRFRNLNLLSPWPFNGPFDFIFCRNVMIYFDRPTQQVLVNRLYGCLRPGGLLFTGHSESLTRVEHQFTPRRPSVYEKAPQ